MSSETATEPWRDWLAMWLDDLATAAQQTRTFLMLDPARHPAHSNDAQDCIQAMRRRYRSRPRHRISSNNNCSADAVDVADSEWHWRHMLEAVNLAIAHVCCAHADPADPADASHQCLLPGDFSRWSPAYLAWFPMSVCPPPRLADADSDAVVEQAHLQHLQQLQLAWQQQTELCSSRWQSSVGASFASSLSSPARVQPWVAAVNAALVSAPVLRSRSLHHDWQGLHARLAARGLVGPAVSYLQACGDALDACHGFVWFRSLLLHQLVDSSVTVPGSVAWRAICTLLQVHFHAPRLEMLVLRLLHPVAAADATGLARLNEQAETAERWCSANSWQSALMFAWCGHFAVQTEAIHEVRRRLLPCLQRAKSEWWRIMSSDATFEPQPAAQHMLADVRWQQDFHLPFWLRCWRRYSFHVRATCNTSDTSAPPQTTLEWMRQPCCSGFLAGLDPSKDALLAFAELNLPAHHECDAAVASWCPPTFSTAAAAVAAFVVVVPPPLPPVSPQLAETIKRIVQLPPVLLPPSGTDASTGTVSSTLEQAIAHISFPQAAASCPGMDSDTGTDSDPDSDSDSNVYFPSPRAPAAPAARVVTAVTVVTAADASVGDKNTSASE